MKSPQLKLVPTDRVVPHPDNPRVVLREDVVGAIVANLGDEYPQKHAVHVRPMGDDYQLLAGHQRTEATRRKGLTEIWAWVEEMDDATAFMELVTSNNQGELSSLEIGIHAFKAVPKAKGKKGGGFADYAGKVGKKKQTISDYVNGAEVYLAIPATCPDIRTSLADPEFPKTFHLAAVHAADRRTWVVLAALIVEKKWTVESTSEAVAPVVKLFADVVPEDATGGWWDVFLPLDAVVREVATNRDFTASKVASLVQIADETESLFEEYRERVDPDRLTALRDKWFADLTGGVGGDSWKPGTLQRWRDEIQTALEGLLPQDGWHQGNWRDHIDKLTDNSVAAVVTDPPYGMGYVSNRRGKKHAEIANDATPADAAGELSAFLDAVKPKLRDKAHAFVFCNWDSVASFGAALVGAGFQVRSHAVWVKNNHGSGDLGALAPKHELILHATVGGAALYQRDPDVFEFDKVATDRHPTEKPVELLSRLIEISTVEKSLVADPFGGVASTPVAALSCGRSFWACELEEAYWKAGDERLKQERAE